MTVVTESEAKGIIDRNVKGTIAVSVDAETVPKMRKTGNPFFDGNGNPSIVKECRMNGLIGFDYESSVNRQDVREGGEGTREAKPRAWGTLTENRLFVEHKGQFYLQMKVQSSSTPVYRDKVTGKVIDTASVKPFLYEKKQSSTQDGIEKEIVVRDVKMSSLRGMRFKGTDYKIVSD